MTTSDGLRKLVNALRPFAEAADDLDEESHRALQVGGYVPTTEDWAKVEVSTSLLYAARSVLQEIADGHRRNKI